jgi:hypothetical protein
MRWMLALRCCFCDERLLNYFAIDAEGMKIVPSINCLFRTACLTMSFGGSVGTIELKYDSLGFRKGTGNMT